MAYETCMSAQQIEHRIREIFDAMSACPNPLFRINAQVEILRLRSKQHAAEIQLETA